MTKDENIIEVEENDENETIALDPLRGSTGQYYHYFEMYSQNKINQGHQNLVSIIHVGFHDNRSSRMQRSKE